MVDECLDLQVTHLNWIQMDSSQWKSRIEKAKVHKDYHVAKAGHHQHYSVSV